MVRVTDPEAAMSVRASAAWARLAEVVALDELQVVVRPESPLALPGCVGVLRLDGTVTVAVPHDGLVEPVTSLVRSVASRVSPTGSVAPALARDARVVEVVGQASLFFGCLEPARPPSANLVRGAARDAEQLLASVSPEEAGESGLRDVTSALSMVKDDRTVFAASGYVHWPSDVAHMCVLAHPHHRGKGYAANAASDAVARALREGLLPQWRARPEPSKALARALGLMELGEQVSIRIHG